MDLHTIIRCAKNVKKIMWLISIISFLLILCFMFINNQNKMNNDYGIGYEHLNYDFNNNFKNEKFVKNIKKDIINFYNGEVTKNVNDSSYKMLDDFKIECSKNLDITKLILSHIQFLLSIEDESIEISKNLGDIWYYRINDFREKKYIKEHIDYEKRDYGQLLDEFKKITKNYEENGEIVFYIDDIYDGQVDLFYGCYLSYIRKCSKNKNFKKALDVYFDENCDFSVKNVGFILKYLDTDNNIKLARSFIYFNPDGTYFINSESILYNYREDGRILIGNYDYESENLIKENSDKEIVNKILKKNSEKIIDDNIVFINPEFDDYNTYNNSPYYGFDIAFYNGKIYGIDSENKIVKNGTIYVLYDYELKCYTYICYDTNDFGEIINESSKVMKYYVNTKNTEYFDYEKYLKKENIGKKNFYLNYLINEYKDFDYDCTDEVRNNVLYNKSKTLVYFYLYDSGFERLYHSDWAVVFDYYEALPSDLKLELKYNNEFVTDYEWTGNTLYFFSDGLIANDGIFEINEKKYLFDELGRLVKSSTYTLDSGDTYLADSEGILITGSGLHNVSKKNFNYKDQKVPFDSEISYYYLNSNNTCVVNSFIIDGENIYFADKDGKLIRNRAFLNRYYFDDRCRLTNVSDFNIEYETNYIKYYDSISYSGKKRFRTEFYEKTDFYKIVLDIDKKYDNYVISPEWINGAIIKDNNNQYFSTLVEEYICTNYKGEKIVDKIYYDDYYDHDHSSPIYIDFYSHRRYTFLIVDVNDYIRTSHGHNYETSYFVKKYFDK